MWFIRNNSTNECVYLVEKTTYTVGKINSDIVIKDDSSISRSHASLHISRPNENGNIILQVEDKGSKYGTFIDDGVETKTSIPKAKRISLANGARVRFGVLNCVWIVSHCPVMSLSSNLSQIDALFLEKTLKLLGGTQLSSWNTTCTHLTMTEVQITIKLLYALLDQTPIVTIKYWRDMCTAVRKKGILPQPQKYLPPSVDIDLGRRPERKTIFKGTTFVFMNRRQYEMYEPIVTKAGGICENLNKGVPKAKLLKPKILVIQYVPSTESQSTQTLLTIEDYLQSHGRRAIPEYEIGLAIVHCSTVKHCNPDYKIVSNSTNMDQASAGGVLVPNTCSNDGADNIEDDEDIAETQINPQVPPRVPAKQQQPIVIELDDNDNNIEVLPVVHQQYSPVKRKRNQILDDDDDDDLFAFSEKPQSSSTCLEREQNKRVCTERTSQQEHATEKTTQNTDSQANTNSKPTSISGFLNKSSLRKTQTQEGTAVAVQPTSNKRTHIEVLTDDDDGNEDDLFNFNDDNMASNKSPHKRPRMNESLRRTRTHGDGDLFNFTSTTHSQQNEDCHDGASMSQMIIHNVPTAGVKVINSPTTVSLPQPKAMSKTINMSSWTNVLNKISMKDEPNEDDTKGNVKKEESFESTEYYAWIDKLKIGCSIREMNASFTTARKPDGFAASTPSSGVNNKKFVKAYRRPDYIATR